MLNLDLTGRTALVTGGTGALGRAIVRTLAACGADVAIHFQRNAELAETLAAEARGYGRRAVCVGAGITHAADVFAFRDRVSAELGAPDIVVASAVAQYAHVPILEQPLEDYVSQFETCVLHSVLVAKAFVPAMIAKGWGRFIGINTEAAVRCGERHSAYAAAKRGMDGVLRVLAREVGGHGITVNQVAPGWMITEKFPGDGSDSQRAYTEATALKRRGDAQEVANAVAFLASDLAGFITGEFLHVSGGSVMSST